MARPTKDGIDYFPLDTNTENDIKFQIIEARFGIVGYGIIIKIYQMIYSNKGYYTEWNELISTISAAKWSCPEFPIDEKTVNKVVRAAAKYGIFNEEKLEKYGVLTSAGIQKRYLEVSKRRKNLSLRQEYLLISAPFSTVNVCNNSINVCNNKEKGNNGNMERGRENSNACIPTLSDIKEFVSRENLKINPEKFYYYYQNKKWQGISDWKLKAKEWNSVEHSKTNVASKNDYAGYDLTLFENSLDEKVRNI